MSEYVEYKNVPLIDEHVMRDEDGNPILNVDEAVLQKIAARNNRRVRETGDMVPTIIGHTKGEPGDYVPEEQQPPVLDAWWHNFKVIPFFKTGKKCVAATFRVHKKLLSKVRKFPRRSVELWLGDWKIDPVALLGATTPSRDLGLLRLAADGRKVYRRVLPQKGAMNDNLVQEIVKALDQTDWVQWVKQQMEKEQASPDVGDGLDDEGVEGPPPDAGADQGLYEDEVPEDDAQDGYDDQDLSDEQEEGKAPVKMSGAACASGTNSFAPGMGKKPRKPPVREQYARNSGDRIRLSRVEQENAQLRKGQQALRFRLARAERERDLAALLAEGYDFDLDEELNDVAPLDDAQYARHLGRIRKRYSKGLTGTSDYLQHSRTPERAGITSATQARDVAQYALDKGISYEKARVELGLD